MMTIRQFLEHHVLTREEVDRFLDQGAPNWAVFDQELGYALKSSIVQDGIDGSHTIATYTASGERRMMNHVDRPCRLNAYGNSYTQCQQVNDGETWEEYLAGHLGEPVRNFGVGGYGVYQAFRRMKRVETGPHGVQYVILGIFGPDDHCRSLDAWRRPRCGDWFRERPDMFHANPWGYVRFDHTTGRLVELPSICPTPESLYRLCDREFVLDTFSDDLAINLYLGSQPGTVIQETPVREAADFMGLSLDPPGSESRHEQVARLYLAYAFRASIQILEWSKDFLEGLGKSLMVVLTYDPQRIHNACMEMPRDDGAVIDYLDSGGIHYADVLTAHREDFKAFRLSPVEYVRRFCIPHYNPAGNHFMAYAIKDRVVDWLDPKPATYPHRGQTMGFAGYLDNV